MCPTNMASPPTFSVVIPVLGEDGVNATLEAIDRIRGDEKVERIVVDGDPQGGTIARVPPGSALCLTAPRGRASQMNAGAARASGRVLVFLHADTGLPQGAFTHIGRAVAAGAAAGAFDLGFDGGGPAFGLIARVGSLRSRLTGLPFGDQAQFFTREAFAALGGFAPLPLMEDVDIMRRAGRLRLPVTILPARVATSARRWQAEGMVRCTVRNWSLLLLYLCGVAPARLARHYPSRR